MTLFSAPCTAYIQIHTCYLRSLVLPPSPSAASIWDIAVCPHDVRVPSADHRRPRGAIAAGAVNCICICLYIYIHVSIGSNRRSAALQYTYLTVHSHNMQPPGTYNQPAPLACSWQNNAYTRTRHDQTLAAVDQSLQITTRPLTASTGVTLMYIHDIDQLNDSVRVSMRVRGRQRVCVMHI